MSMETNLHGRLRNTSLPRSHGLLPMFETVVNSIHSIEETASGVGAGRITIEIVRNSQGNFDFGGENRKKGTDVQEDIVGFKVIDNGVGFNIANMKSFETLDSEYKVNKGGRGIGRLLWLKAFRNVTINSVYKDENDKLKSRDFRFTATSGVSDAIVKDLAGSEPIETRVFLEGFEKEYREASLKTVGAIANSLLEHCLWYFVRPGGAPVIRIVDGDEVILLDDVYSEYMHTSASLESVVIKGKAFDLTHVRLRATGTRPHVIAFCASNRLVKDENITGKIPGLHSKIKDLNGEFVYACYVSSPFLDESVRAERTGFNINEEVDGLYVDTDISLVDIRNAVLGKVSEHLSEYLKENMKLAADRVEKFVSQKAPRYRPIMARISAGGINIDPNISDKDLDLTLHKFLSEIEGKLLSEGHDLMSPMQNEELKDYQARLSEYLKTADDIKKSDLANYVFHRKVILDILGKAIERGKDGKYACEDLIHSLIMPMRKDSNDVKFDSFNLWLVDERLAFHDYLASDTTLVSMPITSTVEKKEPDICALNVFDNPILVSEGTRLPLASIVVVEIKRPMRNDAAGGDEKDPIEQALGYLDKIRKGSVQTASGRQIPNSEEIPGYCYAICDITSSIEKRCKLHGLTVTSDRLGYFGYNPGYKAYIEVISFDRLVNAAKERNRAFFDKLGLPTA